jgi:hypothetical protein
MPITPEGKSFSPEPIYGRQNTYCAPTELAATRVRTSAPSSYWDRGRPRPHCAEGAQFSQ